MSDKAETVDITDPSMESLRPYKVAVAAFDPVVVSPMHELGTVLARSDDHAFELAERQWPDHAVAVYREWRTLRERWLGLWHQIALIPDRLWLLWFCGENGGCQQRRGHAGPCDEPRGILTDIEEQAT